MPSDAIGRNVLNSLGVPEDRTDNTLELIVSGAGRLGLLADISGRRVVDLAPALRLVGPTAEDDLEDDDDDPDDVEPTAAATDTTAAATLRAAPEAQPASEWNRKVFVSHGSNKKIVDQLKGMLTYGEFEPVVSVERETTSKPVPEKVLDDMRSCRAGIIHVGTEGVITDGDGNKHRQLNSNVLIEIGAAMALYGQNFILLVEEGTQLPSNLQGLFEVRYQGTSLDADATMRLLRAFQTFKS